ncbi:MAG: lipid II flippase MurJ, partial [Phycisphaerae bacterium]
ARVLRWYGLGMTAFCCQHILLRGFYSLKDTITPMKISCWLVGLNIVLNVSLLWHPGIREQAFGISTTITSFLHIGISIWLLRRRLGGVMGARAIALSAIKTAVATAAASGAAWAVHGWVPGWVIDGFGRTGRAGVDVFVPLAAAVAAFFVVALILRMKEPAWLDPG